MLKPSDVAPGFDPELLAAMTRYLTAVDSGDLDVLETLYAPDFVNIRWDRRGFAADLRRDLFLGLLHTWNDEGGHPEPEAEWTRVCATSRLGEDDGLVLLLRTKAGCTSGYTFLWRRGADGWQVVRELTLQHELPGVPADATPPPVPSATSA